MASKEFMKFRETRITVTSDGGDRFPLDMLRYDNCVPFSEVDVIAMSQAGSGRPTMVVLRRFVPSGALAAPSVERWESFGWKVRSISGVRRAG